MRFKTVILLFILLGLNHFTSAQSSRFYMVENIKEYSQVLEMSIDEEKLMLLAVYRDDGYFEKMIRSGVFRTDSLKSLLENVLPVAIFHRSAMASRLFESFGTNSLPTFLIMNSEEFLLNAAYGEQSAEEMIDFVAVSKDLNLKLDELRTAYKRNKLNKSQWVMLIGLYELNLDFLSTQSLALEFLSDLPKEKLLEDSVKAISLGYGIGLESPYPEIILKNKDQLDSAEFANYFASCYSFNLDLAIENQDTILLEKIITSLIPISPEPDSTREEMIRETRILFAAESGVFSVWENEAIRISAQISDSAERAEYLYDEAFEIAEAYNSSEAQTAARDLVSLASSLKATYKYYMLEAYMNYLIKEYDKALALLSKAEALSSDNEDLQKLERLRTIIRTEKEKE